MNIIELLQLAIKEDIGDGDHTSLACIPANATNTAQLIAKEEGIIAGVEIAEKIFKLFDPELKVAVLKKDGDKIKKGDVVLTVFGNAQKILSAERLVLNYMQRMSGIATKTHQIVEIIKPYNTKILDTRKTTPLNRYFEKLAVKIGGGTNHRFGLYDMVMIKDNHIDFAGGIKNAIQQANDYLKTKNKPLQIEIEVRNFEELNEVLSVGNVDIIMLDNFTPNDLQKAVQIINHRFKTEASGGINESTIVDYAKTGVDFISIGALTHHIKSLDLSLKAVK
jgi:nicotinate-nucleotide pyrophosphorylase (carboxylating)